MQTITRPSGLRVIVADHVDVTSIAPASPLPTALGGDVTRGGPPNERVYGTVPLEPEPETGASSDILVSAMRDQDMQLVDSIAFGVTNRSEDVRRSLPEAIAPPTLAFDVATDENAVILFEKDGIYSWQLPGNRSASTETVRGVGLAAGTTTIEFTVPLYIAAVGESAADRRLPGLAITIDRVRAYVFKFLAHEAATIGIRAFERKIQKRLVLMNSDDPREWGAADGLADIIPLGSPAPSLLLFVHGTFSSTIGSFGALGATEWGRAFLKDARDKYDHVIGYDHPTLGEDPLANAQDLLARLRRDVAQPPARIDAVAYSRGGLVLRSLTEELLPLHNSVAHVDRAIFVGSTNAGTLLARKENWHGLIDLYTNLAVAGCNLLRLLEPAPIATTILEETLKSLGALLKALATEVSEDIAGLAAMNPDGDFVHRINASSDAEALVETIKYATVTSDFDVGLADATRSNSLPTALLRWLINRGIDGVMNAANDLVVNTTSMSAGDSWVHQFMRPAHEFGRNPHVYHTVYFAQRETADAIRRTFDLAEGTAHTAEIRRAPGDPNLLPTIELPYIDNNFAFVSAENSLGSVVRHLDDSKAKWAVVWRPDVPREQRSKYLYAFTAAEVAELIPLVNMDYPLHTALQAVDELEMHETRRSNQSESGALLPSENEGLTGKRTIEMRNGEPIGVHDFLDASRPLLGERGDALRAAVLEMQQTIRVPRDIRKMVAEEPPLMGTLGEELLLPDVPSPRRGPGRRTGGSRSGGSRGARGMGVGAAPGSDGEGMAFQEMEIADSDIADDDGIEIEMGDSDAGDADEIGTDMGDSDAGQVDGHAGTEPSDGGDEAIDTGDTVSRNAERMSPDDVRNNGDICHIAASMPALARVRDEIDIDVTLSLDEFIPRNAGIVGTARGVVELNEQIDVFVQGKRNFASIGEDHALVTLTSRIRATHISFPMRALAEGPGEIWVVATQRARVIGTVILNPQIVSEMPEEINELKGQTTARRPGREADLTPVLQIFEQIVGEKEWRLQFALSMPNGPYLNFRSKTISGDRQAYVQQVYKDIETEWTSSQRESAAFERNLVGYGSKLLDALVPVEVQSVLWENRETLTAIQVVSEEPFLPWELVYLHEPPSPAGIARAALQPGKFFAELGLVRWLHNVEEPPSEIIVREGKASYVIPDYAPPNWRLPAAQDEIAFLKGELFAQPVAASAASTLKALACTDEIDLFHFSGHGMVPDSPTQDAVMTMRGYLAGNNQYQPEYLPAATVKANPPMSTSETNRPWVTLNACQLGRMTFQLQSVGGFAPAFLHIGAGVFVAALWSVRDAPARVFSEELYRAFFIEGMTLAHAATHAREKARQLAQDTWLSYAVYGRPTARGTRERKSSQATAHD